MNAPKFQTVTGIAKDSEGNGYLKTSIANSYESLAVFQITIAKALYSIGADLENGELKDFQGFAITQLSQFLMETISTNNAMALDDLADYQEQQESEQIAA